MPNSQQARQLTARHVHNKNEVRNCVLTLSSIVENQSYVHTGNNDITSQLKCGTNKIILCFPECLQQNLLATPNRWPMYSFEKLT